MRSPPSSSNALSPGTLSKDSLRSIPGVTGRDAERRAFVVGWGASSREDVFRESEVPKQGCSGADGDENVVAIDGDKVGERSPDGLADTGVTAKTLSCASDADIQAGCISSVVNGSLGVRGHEGEDAAASGLSDIDFEGETTEPAWPVNAHLQ